MNDVFRLELELPAWQYQIGYADPILLLGSCFTDHMYNKLSAYKFRVQQNPHGTLFNPVSISRAVADYVANRLYELSDLVLINEGWHSWHHHKQFSSPNADIALHRINTAIAEARRFLLSARCCIITLGSAFVSELVASEDGQVVANCHRAPADWFRRRLLGVAEVQTALADTLNQLWSFNPDLHVIFTVSPVRHLREGFLDNNRSKATLLLAVYDIVSQYTVAHYFPSYELVIDDLRDYRFYAEDMVHPNYMATNYVWNKFVGTCFDHSTRSLMKNIEQVMRAYTHVPFNAQSRAHRKFLDDNRQKVLHLQEQLPFLEWRDELHHFAADE